jgi:hypothetical protein
MRTIVINRRVQPSPTTTMRTRAHSKRHLRFDGPTEPTRCGNVRLASTRRRSKSPVKTRRNFREARKHNTRPNTINRNDLPTHHTSSTITNNNGPIPLTTHRVSRRFCHSVSFKSVELSQAVEASVFHTNSLSSGE